MNEALKDDVRLGAPQAFKNMVIFPIMGDDEGAPSYKFLDEALERGAVVSEVSLSGSVPTLAFDNKTTDPVLLVEGDELRGARQNRILNLTIFVGPGVKIEIPVSCIEAGRWRYEGSNQFSSGATAGDGGLGYGKLRAANNAFVSNSLKFSGSAVGNQGAVWNDIGKKFAATETRSFTGSMSDVYAQKSQDVKEFAQAFTHQEKQRGAVVCIDGKPVGLEMFDSAAAFKRFMERLVRSYALDAIETVARTDNHVVPDVGEVRAFIELAATAPTETYKTVGEGDALRWRTDVVTGAARVVGGKAMHVASFATA